MLHIASRLPASYFAMVLGLVGLGNSWRLAVHHWNAPAAIGEAVMGAAFAVWLTLIFLYALKWITAPEAAMEELQHPIQCCFISLVFISTMVMTFAVGPYSRDLAFLMLASGMAGHLLFSLYRTGKLWRGGRDQGATTPVLYLPSVAGNFVSAIAASNLGLQAIAPFFFGAGLFSWLAIESVLLQRLYTHETLSLPLRPTLGIQLAPPAVACLAYLACTSGTPDLIAHMLFGYALLQALMLLRLLPWISEQPFSAAYWAFAFGVIALPLAAIRMIDRGDTGLVAALAPVLFVGANVIIGTLAIGTVKLLLMGKLLPPEASSRGTPDLSLPALSR
jgi:tellurite resistance protein